MMKFSIFGSVLVLAVLAVLFVLTGGDAGVQTKPATASQPAPSNNDADFKNLKIN